MFKRLLIVFFLLSFSAYAVPKKIVASAYTSKTYKKPVIVLDAGHGGIDRGAKIKYPYVEEKRVALTTTLLTKKYLEQMGYVVRLTRASDQFVPLKKRAQIANQAGCELFVSFHYNSCLTPSVNGIEIYYHNSKNTKKARSSQNLASSVLQSICNRTNAKSRGVKRGDFCVVRETKMPAVLIEGGFLTNSTERDNIRKKAYLEKISQGVAEGIDNFIKKFA